MSMGQMPAIKITGIEATIAALKKFEPEMYKRMKVRLRAAGREVSNLANARLPRIAQGGFGTKISDRGKSVGMVVYARAGSKSGMNAAIFEFAKNAGTASSSMKSGKLKTIRKRFASGPAGGSRPGGSQGAAMVSWLSNDYGQPGRFLWQAWDLKRTAVIAEVEGIWRQGEVDLQASMDRAGVK